MPATPSKPRILISRALPEEVIARARSRADVDLHAGDKPLSKTELMARVKDREGLVCLITDTIDASVLESCPALKVVSNVAVGFNMRVLYQDAVAADPATERELRATRTDTATLLRDSDFVSIHTPLLPDTRHLINAQSLRTMKKTAYLVNASRGPVVDEAALVQALTEGWIAGAGLDVFEEEP